MSPSDDAGSTAPVTVERAPEFGVVVPQLGGTWEEVVRFARMAEDGGFDSVWVVDHLIGVPPEAGILEAWTVMSALAGSTTRIGIGAKVLCQSFRNPALLAKMATTLDLVSHGRLRFLLGTGWMEAEYRAFGFPFPGAGARVEQLEDAISICRGMFDSGSRPFSHAGAHHQVSDVVNVPPPERRIPIGVGAVGDRMLDVVARLGDEWNLPAMVLGRYDDRRRALEDRLSVHGRDVRRSVQLVFAPGARALPPWLSMFRPALGVHGSRQQMVDRTGQLAESGVSGFYGFVADEAALADMADALPDLRAVLG